LVPYNTGTYYSVASASGGDGYNVADTSNLIAPVERDLVYALGRYDLSDNVRLSTELMTAWVDGTESDNQTPTFNAPLFGGAMGAIQFSTNNPFLSDQARDAIESQGLTTFYVGRTNRDIIRDAGVLRTRTKTHRGVISLEGDFDIGAHDFYWDVSANFGRSYGDTRMTGLHQQRFLYAIDAVRAPDGSIVCNVTLQNPGSTNPDIANCRPLNVFGPNAASREAADYLTVILQQDFDMRQTNFQASLGGELFSLPGGRVAFAAGVEHRKEKGEFLPNEISRGGVTRDVPVVGASGSYHTNEVYGEVLLPVIGNGFTLPMVENLHLRAAGRLTDNSQAGNDNAWDLSLNWNPIEDVTLRASKSRTFRAPSLVESFLPRSSLLMGAGTDPCDARNINSGPNPQARLANCRALFASLGLPADYSLTSIGQSVAVPQTVGGNPSLKNEVADSWTAGLMLTPQFLRGFRISADYISISIEDAIAVFNAASIMSTCFDADIPSPSICGLVTRDANAQITGATTGYVNAGFTEFRGVSYSLAFSTSLGSGQDLSLELNLLNTRRQETSVSGLGFDLDPVAGETSAPHWKGLLSLRYSIGPVKLAWFTNYVDAARFNLQRTAEDQDVLGVGAYFKHDASIAYSVLNNVSVRAGVNNIFDSEPEPFAIGAGGGSGFYDVIGRSFFFGIKGRF
jgi:iron complex outermembrane receptor protein